MTAMPTVELKRQTYGDYAKLPEAAKRQLINGKIVEIASPIIARQRILRKFAVALTNIVERCKLGDIASLILPQFPNSIQSQFQ
jgi:Uma2 family endonuclease